MYLMLIFLPMVVIASNIGESFKGIPSSKDIRGSKVNYHREKLCMIKVGSEQCFMSDASPGDPKAVASLVNIQKFEDNVKSKRRRINHGF